MQTQTDSITAAAERLVQSLPENPTVMIFEGVDGSGKTTLLRAVHDAVRKSKRTGTTEHRRNYNVVVLNATDPALHIIQHKQDSDQSPEGMRQLMSYAAATIANQVADLLVGGTVDLILLDRCALSSTVYNNAPLDFFPSWLNKLEAMIRYNYKRSESHKSDWEVKNNALRVDLQIVLCDVPAEVAIARIQKRRELDDVTPVADDVMESVDTAVVQIRSAFYRDVLNTLPPVIYSYSRMPAYPSLDLSRKPGEVQELTMTSVVSRTVLDENLQPKEL